MLVVTESLSLRPNQLLVVIPGTKIKFSLYREDVPETAIYLPSPQYEISTSSAIASITEDGLFNAIQSGYVNVVAIRKGLICNYLILIYFILFIILDMRESQVHTTIQICDDYKLVVHIKRNNEEVSTLVRGWKYDTTISILSSDNSPIAYTEVLFLHYQFFILSFNFLLLISFDILKMNPFLRQIAHLSYSSPPLNTFSHSLIFSLSHHIQSNHIASTYHTSSSSHPIHSSPPHPIPSHPTPSSTYHIPFHPIIHLSHPIPPHPTPPPQWCECVVGGCGAGDGVLTPPRAGRCTLHAALTANNVRL